MTSPTAYSIAAFYLFCPLEDYQDLQQPLVDLCDAEGVVGTILLASEGVNGTIGGTRHGIDAVLDHLRSDPRLADLTAKRSDASAEPFLRMKVRLKTEIVTLGAGPLDVAETTGVRVAPRVWNELIARPDVLVLDTRNDYESAIGSFEGAIQPGTNSFTDFPEWVNGASEMTDKPAIAMFCTGGIRCEKASAWLAAQGFETVFQLDGGILNYLETVSTAESRWDGECYVFDRRVSVGHGLVPGDYEVCQNCNTALDATARQDDSYVKGVVCGTCAAATPTNRKQRFAERQRQIELAESRGERHLGQL